MDSFLNSAPNSITINQGYDIILASDCNLLLTNAVMCGFLTKTTWYRYVTGCIAVHHIGSSSIRTRRPTGKSTLLVETMCRWLEQCDAFTSTASSRPLLLVCAPTNKAVFVLLERFMKVAHANVNIAIVGDSDKLLGQKPKESVYYQYCTTHWSSLILQELESIQQTLSTAYQQSCRICTRERVNDLMQLFHRRVPNAPMPFADNLKALHQALHSGDASRQEQLQLSQKVSSSFRQIPSEPIAVDFMKTAHVVFSTLCSSGSLDVQRTGGVPTLIVDEAAAATEPDLHIPFHVKPNRMLIVGDPKQLPSVVSSDQAKKGGFDVSLHERLMKHSDAKHCMHPHICEFPSRRFYDGALINGRKVRNDENRGVLCDGSPFLFLRVNGMEQRAACGSMYNTMEVDVITALVQGLHLHQCNTPDKFRIITFYSAQLRMIRQRLDSCGLHDVLVSTVDSSQGCESDVVVISFVRTNNSAGFITDDRRMNVALTRARHQLVCVGNVDKFPSMSGACTIQELARHAVETNAVATYTEMKRSQMPRHGQRYLIKRQKCALSLAT
jgi:AAA domain